MLLLKAKMIGFYLMRKQQYYYTTAQHYEKSRLNIDFSLVAVQRLMDI
jgi:hypothetical protein